MWAVIIVVVLSLTCVSSLPLSPCPDVYGYEKDEYGELKGLIAFMSPIRYSDVQVVVDLSSPVPVADHELGELSLKGGKAAAQEATRQVLLGRRHLLQFYITFPPGKPTPTLLNVKVNGRDFCVSHDVPEHSRARITLHSFLSTGVSAPPSTDFQIVGGLPPSVSGTGGPHTSQDSLVSMVAVPADKDDFYLSRTIVKLLNTLVDIQKQRLDIEQQILALGKRRHSSDSIHFEN